MRTRRRSRQDPDRVASVYEAYQGLVEAIARRQLPRDEADDLVQEVGVRLCRSLQQVRRAEALGAWVAGVTANAAHDWHRAAARRRAADHEPVADLPDPVALVGDRAAPEERLWREQRQRLLWAALRRLPPLERGVLGRRYGLGLFAADGGQPLRAIARTLQVSPETVRAAHHRGLARLRRLLGAPEGPARVR